MTDPLDRVLDLVASGRLTADEAAPILDALEAKAAASAESANTDSGSGDGISGPTTATAKYARVEVREKGRRIVDLRVPISLGRFALARVPLSKEQITEIEEAVVSGARGPIFDVEDADGDGVRIILE
jgi:SHOCT-like protein